MVGAETELVPERCRVEQERGKGRREVETVGQGAHGDGMKG